MKAYDRNGDLIATSDNSEVIKRVVKNLGQDNVVIYLDTEDTNNE